MTNFLRIIFAGTTKFSAKNLNKLILFNNYKILGIITKPDHFSIKSKKFIINPVKKIAIKYNIPIFQPLSLNSTIIQEWIIKVKSDIIVVVDYGLIFPKLILKIPRLGCINVHGSLLPRWRGAAPIQRALISGDKQTGITIIKMDEGIDTGPIINKIAFDIEKRDTSYSIYKKLMKISPCILVEAINLISSNNVIFKYQNNELSTYANKIKKNENKINWKLSSEELDRYIRAFNPKPVSYFTLFGKLIKVWDANNYCKKLNYSPPGTVIKINKFGIYIATGNGILTITKIQLEGKKIISINDFLNSNKIWFNPGLILK